MHPRAGHPLDGRLSPVRSATGVVRGGGVGAVGMSLEFRVLGPVEACRDGAPVALGSPKQRALLLSLLLRPGETVPVDRLSDELWRGAPPAGARTSLHSYVSRLRAALGDRDATLLRTRSGGYELAVDRSAIDAHRFQDLTAEGRARLAASEPQQARRCFEDALGLWRGQALAEVADEPFAQPEIARLEQLRGSAQEDAIEALLALGEHAEAIARLGPMIDARPLAERSQAQLLLARYRSGRQTEALEGYQAYRQRLADELGLDPGPELRRLADAVLQHDPALRAPAPAAVPVSDPSEPDVGVASRGGRTPGDHVPHPRAPGPADRRARPLVGRERELAVLGEVLEAATSGAGRVLLLAGDPGIGKTRLLEELAARAQRAGATVLWGRSHEGGGAPAFWPWLQVLRAAEAHPDVPELLEMAAGDVAPLTQLVPEFGSADGSGAAAASLEQDRFVVVEAVARVLARLADTRPTVLLLEDLHWADGPSLELLVALVAQVAGRPMAIAATHRDVAAERGPELEAALAALARYDVVRHLSPAPLTRADVTELLSGILGAERVAAVAGIVHDRADGNPFFVTEFGRLLDAEGVHPVTAAAVPTGVHHVVQRRYRSLPSATQELLKVGAVAGRDFDLRVVASAAGTTLEDASRDLGPAVEHRLVEESKGGVTVLRFVHALVRETILDGVPALRAAQLHLAVGDAIETTGVGKDRVEELAEHFWQAADVGGQEQALRTALAAATANEERVAYELAEEQLRRALELSSRSTEDRGPHLAVRTRLTHLLVRMHGYQAPGLAELLTATPSLEEPVDPVLVHLSHNPWILLHSSGRYTEALEVAERILEQAAAHADDPVLVALGSLCSGASCTHLGRTEDAVRHFEAGHRQLTGDLERFAVTASHLAVDLPMYGAVARATAGDADGARRWSAEAIERADGFGQAFARTLARTIGAWVDALLDDATSARARSREALDLASTHQFDHLGAFGRIVHDWAVARLGEPVEQLERLEEALTTLRTAGQHVGMASWLGLLADVHLRLGDVERAREVRDRAREAADVHGEHGFDGWLDLLDARVDDTRWDVGRR